jgi:hypothetical protein
MVMLRRCKKTLLLTEDTTGDKDAGATHVGGDEVEHDTVRR